MITIVFCYQNDALKGSSKLYFSDEKDGEWRVDCGNALSSGQPLWLPSHCIGQPQGLPRRLLI
jgi:hypothetical protein